MHADDIESLFYVFVWIMILYDGPLGRERADVNPKGTVLGRWSDDTIYLQWPTKNLQR
jgi:hypothetical protein